eukprot:TRINITY_DN16689_c0_g1_i1.p1 TRINITY_DN16689_c0_g1~~TRINITY_DN16689_c0_g1_i1.p1  ORF type:complete len:416 (-),score=68.80 TRINITY_DN16689_c0_g1_i1:115-1320(-)
MLSNRSLRAGASALWRLRLGANRCRPAAFSSLQAPCALDSQSVTAGKVSLAGLGLAAIFATSQAVRTNCDGEPTDEVNLMTYNILSPPLARPSQFPTCKPADLDAKERLPKIIDRLKPAMAAGSVVGLQEVNLEWAGKLHAFFAENDYCAVFGQYGSPFNGYMGVMVAWPRRSFEVQEVEICRISDTASKGTWPKDSNSRPLPWGLLSKPELKEILGDWPPASAAQFNEWEVARDRKNEAVFVKLRPRGSTNQSFVVSTYHMPCLFGSAPKLRVMNIHVQLLLKHLSRFADGAPAVLMGDFNFKPPDSAYFLASSGGDLHAAARAWPEELRGLEHLGGKAFPDGLQSAYRVFHGQEPRFTNYAFNPGHVTPFIETLDYIWYSKGFTVLSHRTTSHSMPLFA